MKKLTKFLLIIVCFLVAIYFLLTNFNKQTENMSSKVGYKVGGGELSMHEYYALAQYFDTYKDYMSKGEYKSAYNMLGITYRQYIPFENFERNIDKEKVKSLKLEDINIVTPSTYELVLNINDSKNASGEKIHYSIVNDTSIDRVYLYPDSFLDYKIIGDSEKTNKIKCELVDYIVYTDKTELNFEIKNSKNEKFNMTEAILYTNLDDVITLNDALVINEKEVMKKVLSFETEYAFPKKIVLKGNVGNKDVEFVFEINV